MKNKILNIILFLLISFSVFSQFPSPKYHRYYNNFSSVKLLNDSEEELIEKQLNTFELETSNEIFVIIVDNLNGMEPWDYATKIGEDWGVGKEKEDNGIIILIKPVKTDEGGRKVFISVGRGLESVIPDITAKEIVNNELTPNLKKKEFYKVLPNNLNKIKNYINTNRLN